MYCFWSLRHRMSHRVTFFVKFVFSFLFHSLFPLGNCVHDVTDLLLGVKTIARYIPMNFMTVYGLSASTVVSAGYSDLSATKIYLPVVAAGMIGKGKILGGYHKSLFNPSDIGETKKFILNAFKWAPQYPNILPRVAIMPEANIDLQDYLKQNGIDSEVISNANVSTITVQDYQVVYSTNIGCREAKFLYSYVDFGGGLIVAVTPEGNFGGHFGSRFPANVLSHTAGFVWGNTKSRSFNVTHIENYITTSVDRTEDTNVLKIWETVKVMYTDINLLDDSNTPTHQYGYVLLEGLQQIPKKDKFFSQNFHDECNIVVNALKQYEPSQYKKISSPHEKFHSLLFHALSTNVLTPSEVIAHNGSKTFLGDYEMSVSQPQILSISLNRTTSDSDSKRKFSYLGYEIFWYSTGIYAKPGKVIDVVLTTDGCLNSFSVQIGSHSGILDYDREWPRLPSLLSVSYFETTQTQVASPYGGLLYILLPPPSSSDEHWTSFSATIQGDYVAPNPFLVGTSFSKDWRIQLGVYEGSWVELEGRYVVITIPVDEARKLVNPEKITLWWDNVILYMMNLRSLTQEGYRKFRFVYDILPDSVYYTEPYPMPINDDQLKFLVNIDNAKPSTNYWEFLTNVGSNFLISDLIFFGMYSQLPSLFALYIFETELFIPDYESHPSINKEVMIGTITTYTDYLRRNFEAYIRDPWLPFYTLLQLKMNFGWVYVTHLLSFNDTDPNIFIFDNTSLSNKFVISSSKIVQLNLISLFESWGWSTIPETKAELQNLKLTTFTLDTFLNDIS